MSFRRATILAAILATLLIVSTPLVLAQQQEGIPPPGGGGAAPGVSNEGTGDASPEDAGTTAGTLVSPGGTISNDPGAVQYDTAPVVPPGYQKVGDSYCPTFDPHGPPCFRVP